MKGFKEFCKKIRHDDTGIGDFARDALSDPEGFKRCRSEKGWIKYLEYEIYACRGAIEACKRAWKEYRTIRAKEGMMN